MEEFNFNNKLLFKAYFDVVTDFPSTRMIRGKYQTRWITSLFLAGTRHCPILAPGAGIFVLRF